MAYSVDNRRKETMLQRLGDAAQLIDDQRFLPFYRSIQIKLEKIGKAEEWGKMIEAALAAEHPSKYFAKLCKLVKDGKYIFVEKVKEVADGMTAWLDDKLVKFGFGKYHPYWRRKSKEFINVNGQAGFVELLEYADRKGINQKQMAAAIKNCKPPRKYYKENVIGAAA